MLNIQWNVVLCNTLPRGTSKTVLVRGLSMYIGYIKKIEQTSREPDYLPDLHYIYTDTVRTQRVLLYL